MKIGGWNMFRTICIKLLRRSAQRSARFAAGKRAKKYFPALRLNIILKLTQIIY